MTNVRLKKWLQKHGLVPTDELMALAAIAISLEDWKREVKKSIRRQRRSFEEDEEEEDA